MQKSELEALTTKNQTFPENSSSLVHIIIKIFFPATENSNVSRNLKWMYPKY